MTSEKVTDAQNETPAETALPTGTLPERVERDSGKSSVLPEAQKKAPKKKAAKKAKKPAAQKPEAPPTQEPPAPPAPPAAAPAAGKKIRKRRAKKAVAAPAAEGTPAKKVKGKRGRKKNWRKGRQWPALPFTLYLNVMTKKPKALSVAIRKLLWHYTVRAPKKGKKA